MIEPFQDEASKEIHRIWIEGLREAVNAPDDWSYIRSELIPEDHERFVKLIGEENIKFVAGQKTPSIISLSMFISPEGVENAKTYRADQIKED